MKIKLPLIFISYLTYILAYYFFYEHVGVTFAGIFLLLPVVIIAWFYGSKIGTLLALVIETLHLFFVHNVFGIDIGSIVLEHIIGGFAVILVGFMIGYSRDTSQRVSELKEQGLALRLGMQRSHDIIFITDPQGIITYANPAFTKVYGYSYENWKGKTPRILKSGETDTALYKYLWTRLKNGESFEYSIVNKTKDGRVLNIESSANPILDEKGGLLGYLAIQKDVTSQKKTDKDLFERTKELESASKELKDRQEALINVLEDQKELQEKLKEGKFKLELIVGSMGEGLLMVGADYKIQMVNLKAQSLLGIEEKEALGKKWSDLVKAYEGDNLIPFEKRTSVQVLKRGASIITGLDDDHYYLAPSGKKFPVISVTTPIVDGENVTGVVKVFKDASTEKEDKRLIEETVRARTAELKEQEEISSAILENAGEGVVLSDSKGKVEYVNPAFINMIGLTEKEILGKEFSDLFKALDLNDKQIAPEKISDAAAVTAEKQEMKIQFETKSKEKIGVLISGSPVHVDGRYVGVVRVMHDITDELSLQQQKDDFFSIASHELRTPLTVISGNLDTLLTYSESNLNESDKDIVKDTIDSSDRLIKLVNDYLNVSRLDQGRLKYEIEEIDACELTKSVAEELKNLASEKGLKLINECGGEHNKVLADKGFLKEILINLIGNSIKFTDEGSIMVKHNKIGDKLKIDVSDTGIGIPKNQQGKLFQRFQQAQTRTLARRAGGTGLGLYISRELAWAMGGDLVIEKSEVGQGSTFALTIPLTS